MNRRELIDKICADLGLSITQASAMAYRSGDWYVLRATYPGGAPNPIAGHASDWGFRDHDEQWRVTRYPAGYELEQVDCCGRCGPTAEDVGPSAGADRPSCLVMNPRNVEASAERRAALMRAFESLHPKVRADLLEEIEMMAFSGTWEAWKHDARELFHQIYVINGWGTIDEDGRYHENRPAARKEE